MSSMIPDEALDAIQAVLNEEFNAGENFSPPVETADVAREDTPVLQIDDRGQARGPDGKFVAVQAPVATDDPTEEVEEEPEAPAEDDDAGEAEEAATDEGMPEAPEAEEEVADEDLILELDPGHPFFQKYGGDPQKALEALENAQTKIGAQGSELGELRQQMTQLMQMVRHQQVASAPYENDIEEDPEALVYEALERGDANTMQQAIEAWGEDEPFKAAMFVSTLPQMLETMSAELAPQAPASTIADEMQALKAKHPDLDKFLPQIQKVLTERPLWQQAIADTQGDPSARAQALEDVYLIARSQAGPDTSEAKKVILRAKVEADKAKANATVVSASRSSAATPAQKSNVLQTALAEMLGDDEFKIVD